MEASNWLSKAVDFGAGREGLGCFNDRDGTYVAVWFCIGLLFYRGQDDVEQNYVEAAKWFSKLAEGSYEKWHEDSDYNSQRRQINDCVQSASYFLGFMYWYGQGVGQDYAKAVKWLSKAAEPVYSWECSTGCKEAQYLLGKAYYTGHGVAQDYSEAVKWYKAAAEDEYSGSGPFSLTPRELKQKGVAEAKNALGDAYRDGHGVEQSYQEAMNWYRAAADQGDADAMNSMADMYAKGEGVGQDLGEAMKWCIKAAQKGNTDAKAKLAKLMGNIPTGDNLLQP
jgi:TPR repeat protein